MDLHQLRCAIAVAEEGGFTRAAERMHLTQPALSYAVANLERELGTRLFERLPRRILVTSAGEALLGPARLAVAEAQRAQAAVVATRGLVAGTLDVASIRTTLRSVGQLLGSLHSRHPLVRISVHEPGGDDDVADDVRSGRCELGVMRATAVPSDLGVVTMGMEEVVALLPPSTRLPKRLTIPRLSREPLVAPLRGTHARQGWERIFSEAGARPEVAIECVPTNELVAELVRAGVGCALVARGSSEQEWPGVQVRPLHPVIRSEIALVHRRGELSPAAAALCAVAAPANHDPAPLSPSSSR